MTKIEKWEIREILIIFQNSYFAYIFVSNWFYWSYTILNVTMLWFALPNCFIKNDILHKPLFILNITNGLLGENIFFVRFYTPLSLLQHAYLFNRYSFKCGKKSTQWKCSQTNHASKQFEDFYLSNYHEKNIFPYLDFSRLLIWYWEDIILTQENSVFNSFAISLRFGYFFP
jgi:hypothetical protein